MDKELQDLYQEILLDYGRKPKNFRCIINADGAAEGVNSTCGDSVKVYIKKDGNKIADISFEGSGCVISQASASIMTEVLKGKTVDEARNIISAFRSFCTGEAALPSASSAISDDDMEKLKLFEGVRNFPLRIKCATLAWHAAEKALI